VNTAITLADEEGLESVSLRKLGDRLDVSAMAAYRHVRDKDVPWSSILWSFAAGIIASLFFTPIIGIIASPLALFLAEWRRLKNRESALAHTKAWMTGWGWSIAARLGIGVTMIVFWGLWAWL